MPYEYINKEFYQTINKSDRRFLNVDNQDNAALLISKLKDADISFSATLGSRNTITLSGNDDLDRAKAFYNEILNTRSAAKTIIGNTAYKYLPDKKYIRTDAETAKELNRMFAGDSNIKFSGVIQGDNATITVSGNKDIDIIKRLISNIQNRDLFEDISNAGFTRLPDDENGFIVYQNDATGEVCGFDGADMLRDMFNDIYNEFFHRTEYRIELTSNAFDDIYYISETDSMTGEEKTPYYDDNNFMPTFEKLDEAIEYCNEHNIIFKNEEQFDEWHRYEAEKNDNIISDANKELISKFPMQNGLYPDHISYNETNNSFAWTYFNPDGDNGSGEFVEKNISEQDIYAAYIARTNTDNEADGRNAFIDYIFEHCNESVIDTRSEAFENYADSYINKSEAVDEYYGIGVGSINIENVNAFINQLEEHCSAVVNAKQNDASMLNAESDEIEIEGYSGTWYVIDSHKFDDKELFLLESEIYGDEAACLIVDENRNVIMDDVYNGFDDYLEANSPLGNNEQLIRISDEIAEKEKALTELVSSKDFENADKVLKEIRTLSVRYDEIKAEIQSENINDNDVQKLRSIQPSRKSVQNMLENEVAQTAKFEKLLSDEMGEKSAYEMRNSDNEWRNDESKTVPVINIQERELPENISAVQRDNNIARGSFINKDTGIEIIFSRRSIEEIIAKAIPDAKREIPVEARISALYQMQALIENAICFDSQISQPSKSKKSDNTLFIHRMYSVIKFDNEMYLANLAIEESYSTDRDNKFRDTNNRLYSFRDIKITPVELLGGQAHAGLQNANSDTPSGVTTITIPQLYELVKSYDLLFFENPNAIGRPEREAEIATQKEYTEAVEKLNEHIQKHTSVPAEMLDIIFDDMPSFVKSSVAWDELMEYGGISERFENGEDPVAVVKSYIAGKGGFSYSPNGLDKHYYCSWSAIDTGDNTVINVSVMDLNNNDRYHSHRLFAWTDIADFFKKRIEQEENYNKLADGEITVSAISNTDKYRYIDHTNGTDTIKNREELTELFSEMFNKSELNGIIGNYIDLAPTEEYIVKTPDEKDNSPKYTIYQIKKGEEYHNARFTDWKGLKRLNIPFDKNSYESVYGGYLTDISRSQNRAVILDDIFRKFNVNRPEDFRGHSLSVSDIIVLEDKNGSSAFFVDSYGMTEVTDLFFDMEKQKIDLSKLSEITLTEEYNRRKDQLDDFLHIKNTISFTNLNSSYLINRYKEFTYEYDDMPDVDEGDTFATRRYVLEEIQEFFEDSRTDSSKSISITDMNGKTTTLEGRLFEFEATEDRLAFMIPNVGYAEMFERDDDSYDYTIYDSDFNVTDSGVYNDVSITLRQAFTLVMEDAGYDIDKCEPMDFEKVHGRAEEKAEQPEAERKKSGSEIAVGDRFLYNNREYTVTSEKGIYPDDVGVSYEEKSGSLTYEMTSNIDRYKLAENGVFLGNPENDKQIQEVSSDTIITQSDIDVLRTLPPRKSVLNFTEDERKLTSKWAERYKSDIAEKSPYYRAESGDWRANDSSRIPIINLENKNISFSQIKENVKNGIIERGNVINSDTKWDINISRKGLEDTIRYADKHNDEISYNLLEKVNTILENSVLLDSQISEDNKNNKANSTGIMHKFYAAVKVGNEPYIAKSTVEEFFNGNMKNPDTLKRFYNLQDIKIEPLKAISLTENQLHSATFNGSDISIADLFDVVKSCDKDFYTNVSEHSILNQAPENSPLGNSNPTDERTEKENSDNINEKNLKAVWNIEVGDEVSLHGDTYIVRSVNDDFMMSMDKKDHSGSGMDTISKQFIGNWRMQLAAESENEPIFVTKSYAVQNTEELHDSEMVNLDTENKKSSEKSFSEQVDEVINGTSNRYNDLKVCDTPQILLDVGCEQLPMLYTQQHLKKAIQPKNLTEHTHGLDIEQIKNLPSDIADPVIILDSTSRNDSILLILSQIDKENCPLVVSVKPNGNGKYNLDVVDSNFITSVYGRENFASFIERNVELDNILYCNKQKSQELFRVLRLQFPQGVNKLDFDTIIHQSRNIVNSKSADDEEKIKSNVRNVLPDGIPMPDASLTVEDMESYGYKYDEAMPMLPVSKEKAYEIGKEQFLYNLYSDNTSRDTKSVDEHTGIFGINQNVWEHYYLTHSNAYAELMDNLINDDEIQSDRDIFTEKYTKYAENSNEKWFSDYLKKEKNKYPDSYNKLVDAAFNNYMSDIQKRETSKFPIGESITEKKTEKSFSEQVDEAINGTLSVYSSLKVCDTPPIFVNIGCEQLPMLYTQKHLKDAIHEKSDENSHWHGLTVDQIKQVPELLQNPAIIMDSVSHNTNANNSIVAVLNAVDNDNAPLIVSIKPNGSGIYEVSNVNSNFITSIYGKDHGFEKFIERAALSDNILFWDKNKSQELFSCQRLQLPEAINNLDSDIIIHQSRNIVNNKSADKLFGNHMSDIQKRETSKFPIGESAIEKHNFHITDDDLGINGAKTRYAANVAAIKTLKAIESENRYAAPDEQEVLSKYTGWGAIPQAFNESNIQWDDENRELKSILTDEEYESARASTLNAHFTSPVVIKAVYAGLAKLGFDGGKILEPAMGTGNFFGTMPESMLANSRLYGVELDSLTGRIAKQLYQNANISITGFEKKNFADNSFDVAVGNVPFGSYKLSDSRYNSENFFIHDYFFAKSLDKVKPGGIVAFITSKGTLDKANPDVRRYLSERAELLGAIRLPNNAFKANSGTEVTSDIIFLKKRNEIAYNLENEPEWISVGQTEDGVPVNKYFETHPEMILGKMKQGVEFSLYGNPNETACVPIDGESLENQLAEAVKNITGYISTEKPFEETVDTTLVEASKDIEINHYGISDNKIYYRINEDSMRLIDYKNSKDMQRTKSLIELKETVNTLLSLELNNNNNINSDQIGEIRAELNYKYDVFVSKYGRIADNKNKKAFKGDSSYHLLKSLELADSNGAYAGKADIFFKNTVKPKMVVEHVENSHDALILSFSEKAKVDFDYMENLTGKSKDTLISDLEGDIYQIPESDEWVTADEYLSGNIRKKLDAAKASGIEKNIAALETSMPPYVDAADIDVELGASWIPSKYIRQFVVELLSPPYSRRLELDVKYSEYTDKWSIENVKGRNGNNRFFNANEEEIYGMPEMNAYEIIETSLNLKFPQIKKPLLDENGNTKIDQKGNIIKVVDNEKTAIALSKQKEIKSKFRDWIFNEPERRDYLTKLYNDKFNSIRLREYNGSNLNFTGMNPEIELKDHQKDAVARQLYGGNTLLAHEVGAGKTYEMVAAAMEGKRLGLHSKALIAVPNSLTEQWGNDFRKLYPNANILVASEKDLEGSKRKDFLAQIATGEYDAIIMSHSAFDRVRLSPEREVRYIKEELEILRSALAEAAANSEGKKKSFSVKQIELSIKNKEKVLNDTLARIGKDDVIPFEQLGIDKLFIDESHAYKNLDIATKMTRVAGIGGKGSNRSLGLLMKCKYLNEKTNYKGITFASGTPIITGYLRLETPILRC